MLAERLGLPHATIIMEVDAAAGGGSLRVKRELESGWFQWVSMPLPALLTIQSGINQLRYATLRGIMAAKRKEIRTVSIEGARRRGSGSSSCTSPRRRAPPGSSTARPRRPRASSWPAARRSEGAVTLVIAEQRGGTLNPATWETLAAAQRMDAPVTVAVLGAGVQGPAGSSPPRTSPRSSRSSMTRSSRTPRTASPRRSRGCWSRPVPRSCCSRTRIRPATTRRRWRRGWGACWSPMHRVEGRDGRRVFVRPMFQGKFVADVLPEGPAPHFASFQIGAYRADACARGASPAAVRAVAVDIDAAAIRQRPEAPFQEAKQAVDLTQAERIVAVGRGIKDREHLPIAQDLARALDAELAASRPICDS